MRISDWSSDVCSSDLFYTRRNLIVFARMWERVESYRGALREGLRFWLLSYNAAHGTIMTRVVAKSGQKDLVVTSAQPGVLYVSGLPVEKNFFAGLRRKLTDRKSVVYGKRVSVQVDLGCGRIIKTKKKI